MAQINNSLAFLHVQVSNVAFTLITIPIDCNKIIIRNGNASGGIVGRVSTDTDNANAYDLIDAGDSRLYEPAEHGGAGVTSYRSGTNLCAAKAESAGTVDFFLTFLQ